MPKIGNKVVNYSIYVRDEGKTSKIADTTSVQLPSIEYLTDTIKGAGILGEIDWPTLSQPGSMSLSISLRVTNEDFTTLAVAKDIEIRWVTDEFDTNNIKTGVNLNKAFLSCVPKKIDEGKIETGSSTDGSFEYEVFAYKRILNGKEMLAIDKFNGTFNVNGKNLTEDFNNFL